jgi:hypothetical protein
MQMKQGTFCPLIKKDCVQLQCAWFTQLRGVHPQTGQEIDEWMCAVSALPMLQIEVAKQARSGAAATESFRNEVVKRADDEVVRRQHMQVSHSGRTLLISNDLDA